MKAFYISGSLVFAVLTLILAFENMGVSINGFLFVFIPLDSAFFAVISIAGVGTIFGIFITSLISHILHKRNEDEEAPGNEWQ